MPAILIRKKSLRKGLTERATKNGLVALKWMLDKLVSWQTHMRIGPVSATKCKYTIRDTKFTVL
jgi:hypothetical protein